MNITYAPGLITLSNEEHVVVASLHYVRSINGKGYQIDNIDVAPDYQGSGIERQLLEAMMTKLKSQFWDWIESYRGQVFLNEHQQFDVIGFMQTLYGEIYGVDLPDTLEHIAELMQEVPVDAIVPGDALFWGNEYFVNQAAIYLGGGKMISVATDDGRVTQSVISSFNLPNFARTLR